MSVKGRPGRPRSESARHSIVKAAYDLLDEQGYAAFSVDVVAARAAAIGKTEG
ncbi:TetR family transcriptional regulator [Ensifer sp. MPMI2T]|nr:TetR family transcriptional regulator [Ensifer sp. MPMI2T]